MSRKPAQPSGNRPVTNDPFQNPILGALREEEFGWDDIHREGDFNLHFEGDLAKVGGGIEGARKLRNAVAACFEIDGLKPEAMLVAELVSKVIGTTVRHEFSEDIKGLQEIPGRKDSPAGFSMIFSFSRDKNNQPSAAHVESTKDRIFAASREIKAKQARQLG